VILKLQEVKKRRRPRTLPQGALSEGKRARGVREWGSGAEFKHRPGKRIHIL